MQELSPNELLEAIRVRVDDTLIGLDVSVIALAGFFRQLDQRLTSGGNLPDDWNHSSGTLIGNNNVQHNTFQS